jgi:tetratricopeptide (TPR) repeat protein
VGVPDSVVEAVSGLDSDARQHLLADKYLGGLLREEGEGMQIYHAILADHILGQVGEGERQGYHSRAVDVYREKLRKAKKEQTRPDALAAVRLPEHILAAEGPEAFVHAFVNECYGPLDMLGLLDAALSFSQRALRMVKKGSEERAAVLGNLGLIYQTRGELDKAEEMFQKSLEISEPQGMMELTANQYGNLGLIFQTRGELDKAEEMFRDGLKIDEKLGRLEGMAAKYGNLGLIYMDKGELDKAEEMHLKSLEIEKKLGRQEGMASGYGNLGLIYMDKGELDKAEEMFRDGLKIDEKLGRLEGMAAKYGNLGAVYKKRGDIKKALEYWEKARDLYERIGMPHMVKKVQGWIGGVGKD